MNQGDSANKADTVLTVLMPYIPQSSGETDVGQATASKCDEYEGFARNGPEGVGVWP